MGYNVGEVEWEIGVHSGRSRWGVGWGGVTCMIGGHSAWAVKVGESSGELGHDG